MSPAEELAVWHHANYMRINYPSLEGLDTASGGGLCALWAGDELPLIFYLAGIKDLAKLTHRFELESEAALLLGILKERAQ